MTTTTLPRRPLWRRVIPARVRLHGGLIAGSVVAMVLIAVLLGTVQIRPIVFSNQLLTPPSITQDVQGSVPLFDRGVPHSIEVQLSNVEYEKLKADFVSKGEKSWVRADVVIDGTRLESVGVRLKGNSTLMSLRGGGAPGGMSPPGGMSAPGGMSPSAGMEKAPAGGPSMSTATFDDPSTLPLLIRFDRFVEGRGYQGRTELAIRPVVGASGANLNEAVALQLVAESGEPSQRFTWASFSLNGAAVRTRLVVEHPESNYALDLGRGGGALFKSKATNSFSYKGEDPTQYTEDFEQLSAKGSLDLAPLISLLKFVQTSTDEEFDAELERWVDVESLARYVATHDLLNNFDDMSGPGRNFLLWYDAGDQRFTVVTWDLNLAITGMGGMGGRPGGGAPGGLPGATGPGGELPGAAGPGGPPGAGFPPEGGPRPEGMGSRQGPGGGGAMRMGNLLKSRFVASAHFAQVRDRAKEELRQLWFESGRAEEITRDLAATIPATDSLSPDAIASEAEGLVTQLRSLAGSQASSGH